MLAQRPASAAPAVKASAEALPFRDDHFDAAMAVLSVHHWSDRRKGLGEMRRVARGPVVVFGRVAETSPWWWLYDYFPATARRTRPRLPRAGSPRPSSTGPTTAAVTARVASSSPSALWTLSSNRRRRTGSERMFISTILPRATVNPLTEKGSSPANVTMPDAAAARNASTWLGSALLRHSHALDGVVCLAE
jgi:SAM-dependent methyltransferase